MKNDTFPVSPPTFKTVAISRRMFAILYTSAKVFVDKYRLLRERKATKNDPLRDYSLGLDVVFYHKKTGRVLSVYEYCDQQLNSRVIARHMFCNLNLPYSLRLKDSLTIPEWQESLDEGYNLNWDELTSMGELKLRFKTKYRFSESFED